MKFSALGRKASIELTSREIVILILAIIIAAIVIGVGVSKLGLIQKALEFISGQGEVLAAS